MHLVVIPPNHAVYGVHHGNNEGRVEHGDDRADEQQGAIVDEERGAVRRKVKEEEKREALLDALFGVVLHDHSADERERGHNLVI